MRQRRRETLTTQQLAACLGVSESSVKRWVDEGAIGAHRTAGGHRRIPVAAAVGFIRGIGARVANPEVLTLADKPAFGGVDGAAAEALQRALIQDDVESARGLICGRYLSGVDVGVIADGLIRPALEGVGRIWELDPDGILIEHRAVETCLQILWELRQWLPPPRTGAPSALTGAGAGDPYLLPPMLAALTLRERGFRARNLGPSTPFETVARGADRYGALVCCMSISVPPAPKQAPEWIRLAEALSCTGTRLVVGGRSAHLLPASVRRHVHVCSSMTELGAFGAGLLEAWPAPADKHDDGMGGGHE